MYVNGTVVRIQEFGLEGKKGVVRGVSTVQPVTGPFYIVEVGPQPGYDYDCVVIPGCCLYELPA
jgi:hypothetical protein